MLADAVKKIGPTNPQATIVGSAGGTALKFVREMLKQGYSMPLYLNSGVNIANLTKELGDAARGMAVVQLMPAVNNGNFAVAREFKKVAEAHPGTPMTTKGLEGFVAAKILVEALHRSGKDLTRERFVQALEDFQKFDLGGLTVHYSATERVGMTYVDLAVISHGGRTLR